MSFGKTFTIRKRIGKAIWALIINAILWIVVPYYVGTLLVGRIPNTPLIIPSFIYEFGILFIILDVGAAFFDGTIVCVPFISGVALLSAYYLWLVTNGGNLALTASGISIGLEFKLLVYILILPSIWAAIRTPIAYAIWRRAIHSTPSPPLAPAA